MCAKYQLQNCNLLIDRSIFFDTNVLIYLFWPTNSRWEKHYASTFKCLLKQRNKLFVDYLVISEVINTIIRLEYKNLKSSLTFKDFRDSEKGKEALTDIYTIVKASILTNFYVIGKSYSKQDILSFLIDDNLDFVDKAIANLCKENEFILLTNDKDFNNSDLDILTGNPSLLK